MLKRIAAALLFIFCFAGCAYDQPIEPNDIINETTPQDEAENEAEHTVNADNPFAEHDLSLTFWEHYIYELYRGAERIEFSKKLSYTNESDNKQFSFSLEYPQIKDDSKFNETLSKYYEIKIEGSRALEDQYIKYSNDSFHGAHYSQEALYAYAWKDYYIVNINEMILVNRLNYTPLCDNFNTSTGERLTLEDLFTVEYDTFSARIIQCLKKPETEFIQNLNPEYENKEDPIPMPQNENFMLTPSGLAFVYRAGEIASMATDVVILYVEYDEIADILAIEI